ncbi:MAG: response regulator [Granulosicoccus sp.]
MSEQTEKIERVSTVIIIDDDETDQFLNQRIVKRSGLVEDLQLIRSAEDALGYLKSLEKRVDVIFLDINMPCMNGFEFLDQAIKELGPRFVEIVVIMLTTSLDPEDKERASKYEIVKGFKSKPLTVETIQQVSSLVNNKNTN